MADIHVPPEHRPFIGRYVAGTAIGLAVVGAFVWLTTEAFEDPLIEFAIVAFAVVASLTVLFLMVAALVKAWFAAAVTGE